VSSALISRAEYAALEHCVYLNQASLGLVPRRSTEAMVGFLVDVAQHGNVRLSDAAEERILDDLRQAAAGLLDAPVRSIAVVGGASEALGQLAILTGAAGGEVVLVASDFPSVTYPWLGARERLGMAIKWVEDAPDRDLTTALVDGIHDGTTVVCISAVQYATGSLVDVGEVVRRARAVGARVIVDVTQMAGAMAVSLRAWSADALVCSGYKWLSTHGGVALLAVDDALLEGVEMPVDAISVSSNCLRGACGRRAPRPHRE
jgi:cysteine desulfurase / selenocysteine lyase